jgi:hypothetical protein
MTFYEQVGIVIPGSVLLFGLVLHYPTVHEVIGKDGVTLGQFGIFLLLSYAAGHLIAAVGNAGESTLWKLTDGMPTDWIVKTEQPLLSAPQVDLVEQKVRSRLGVVIDNVRGLDTKVWFPISRQIYADVMKNGKVERIDAFNGNYGLNRGLAAATFVLACVSVVNGKWGMMFGLLVVSAIFAYRAYRFGVHYARELYLQFLVLNEPGAAT